MTTAQTAHEAFERYAAALESGLLIQNKWQKEDEGRNLVCALGVIGNDVSSVKSCPAQIMPSWLAQKVLWFFDYQDFDDAKDWGLRFYQQIARLNGQVPFSVIHDWEATTVCPIAIEVMARDNKRAEAHTILTGMHAGAQGGKKFTVEEWQPVIKASFMDLYPYVHQYVYDIISADKYSSKYAFSYSNADTISYELASTYEYAYTHLKSAYVKRLADGMIECLARVPTTKAE